MGGAAMSRQIGGCALRRLVGDRGSILPLILGSFAIAGALTALLVDTTYMRIERLHADAWAEQTALAAATQIDLSTDQSISTNERTRISLNQRAAKRAALAALADYPARDLGNRRLVSATWGNGVAAVVVSTTIRLPFTSILLRVVGKNGSVTVRSYAAAATYADPRR